jgi:hypothetical protein
VSARITRHHMFAAQSIMALNSIIDRYIINTTAEIPLDTGRTFNGYQMDSA